MCKVPNCTSAHDKHYCRLCQKDDVSHFAMDCPEGVDLWHGTKISNLSSISQNRGLKASGDGRLGSGVYFASKEIATAVSKHRGAGTGVVILCCRVRLGKTKHCGAVADKTWHGQYDSATGTHGAWGAAPSFTEYVLKDERRHRIKEVHVIDGTINGDIWLPRVNIRVKGNVTFKCNVTAGSLIIG